MVRDNWLVIKAEDLCDVVEIGMLSHQRPLRVVHSVVEVSDCHFYAPVFSVVDLHVPMDAYGAHVVRALQERCVVLSRRVYSHHLQLL